MADNFHLPSGKALFGATADDDGDVKQNGEQCIRSQREMLRRSHTQG